MNKNKKIEKKVKKRIELIKIISIFVAHKKRINNKI